LSSRKLSAACSRPLHLVLVHGFCTGLSLRATDPVLGTGLSMEETGL